jgi:phage tail-like protein
MNPLPPVGYYFLVNFLMGVSNPLALAAQIGAQVAVSVSDQDVLEKPMDARFQKVSGFRVSMQPQEVEEGGLNIYSHRLPTRYSYSNLILERGIVMGSLLNLQFQDAMANYRFNPSTVLVNLLNENDHPVVSWLFMNAYPVSWSSSDLNADENKVVIETLELAYSRFQRLSL